MLYLAIALFGVAAILGAVLLVHLLQNNTIPKKLAMTHGIFASIGIVLLVIYATFNSPKPIVSIVIFILAAAGGITLVHKQLTGKPLPKLVAVGHGLLAIIGFITLVLFSF